MARSNVKLCSLLFWLLFFQSGICQAEAFADHVFIISIDGGRPDLLRTGFMPTLHSILPKSARTWKARTVQPNLTLPSHVSMLTGVDPKTHQITWNKWDKKRGKVKVPTIFHRAKKAGFRTAIFAAKEKFKHLHIPEALSAFSLHRGSVQVAQAAADYIVEEKPNLVFVHLPEADHVGHWFGWGSIRQKNALKTVDQGLNIILTGIERAGLTSGSVVIITADHGGFGFGHTLRIPANYQIPWIVIGKRVRAGHELKKQVTTIDTAATALWLLGLSTQDLEGRPVIEAFQF